MKYILITCCLLVNIGTVVAQAVAINTDKSAPNASAILDVKSFTKGMLLPRTSTTSRNAIINPAKGLLLYTIAPHYAAVAFSDASLRSR